MKRLLLILTLLVGSYVFACDEASFTLNSETDNGDGTYTYNFDICVEVTGLEGWPDWFQVKFKNGTFTSVVNNSWSNDIISSSTGDDYDGTLAASSSAVRWESQFVFGAHCCNTICATNVTVKTNGKPSDIDVSFHDTYGGACDQTYNIPTLLPIELLSFDVEYDEGFIFNWVTTSERNVDRFEVLWSVDGYNWGTLLTAKAVGNSTINQEYTYVSEKMFDVPFVYFRLKEVDYDGYEEYFRIVAFSLSMGPTYREIFKIYTLDGIELSEMISNQLLIIQYSDGTTEKVIQFE